MDIEYINQIVTTYITQAIAGLDKEHAKFDFKRKWYNLKNLRDINEFLKDATSIVNTVGPDGFIVIGFDDKSKEFYDSKFSDSSLRDSSDLVNLISKRVDRMFVINSMDIVYNEHALSVLHIPPSIDKPHMIRQYQVFDENENVKKEEENKIWVRKGSRASSANKYDLEVMYYDRKNIIPDYDLSCYLDQSSFSFNVSHYNQINLSMYLTIENSGRRPVAISTARFTVTIPSELHSPEFILEPKYRSLNLIVKPGEIWNGRLEFLTDSLGNFKEGDANKLQRSYNDSRNGISFSLIKIMLANGNLISCKLLMQ